MTALTPRQQECLDYIRSVILERGMAPTYSEIMVALGLHSKQNVYRMVVCLEERGALRRIPGRARAISLVDKQDETDALAFLDPFSQDCLTRLARAKKTTTHAALAEICRRFFDGQRRVA